MDCSLPGSSVYGICQARRVLEWVAIAFSAKIILTQSYLVDLKKTSLRKIIMADPGYGQNCEHAVRLKEARTRREELLG